MSRKVKEAARRQLARQNFRDFVKYTFPGFKENWHHKVLMEALNGALNFEEEYRNLIVVTPPRHGKSELVSRRAPAYALGRHPQLEVIHSTYSDDLCEKMGRDVGDILQSKEFSQIFPNFKIGSKNTQQEKSTTAGGTYKSAGVGAGITGRGANLIIVDDPIKSREEAESAKTRDRIWDWFQDDLMTRREYPYSVVITMTRWHQDDLVGRLLQREPDRWKLIHLPLIADYHKYDEKWPDYDPRDPGDVLWPGVRVKGSIDIPGADVPSDDELAEQIKADFEEDVSSNPYGTYSLDQGRPVQKEGTLLKRDWFHRYQSPPSALARYCNNIIISIDANLKKTSTGSDAALMVLGLRRDGTICVLDGHWSSLSFVELKKKAKRMAKKWPSASLLIEDKANGPALISSLEEFCTTIPFDPGKNNKEVRASKLSDMAEAGRIALPAQAVWVEELLSILTSFPGGSIDDPVDAIAQACLRWDRKANPLKQLRRVTGQQKVG